MAIDEDKIEGAAEGFSEHARNCYGSDAELLAIAVVGMVRSGDGNLAATYHCDPAGGPVTAWMLRAAADAM